MLGLQSIGARYRRNALRGRESVLFVYVARLCEPATAMHRRLRAGAVGTRHPRDMFAA